MDCPDVTHQSDWALHLIPQEAVTLSTLTRVLANDRLRNTDQTCDLLVTQIAEMVEIPVDLVLGPQLRSTTLLEVQLVFLPSILTTLLAAEP